VLWRKTWKENQAPDIKARLLQYNQDDCRELKCIVDFVRQVISQDSTSAGLPNTTFKIALTEELATARPRCELFRPREYALEDLEKVAKCAYFDYQREKVFFRTHPHLKVAAKKKRRSSTRVNAVSVLESGRCPCAKARRSTKARK
jgi:hypothetical protein